MADEITWESLAKKPGGDSDKPYFWGNPRGGLTTIEQGHLTIMRGVILDVSHAPLSIRDQLRYGGDSADQTELTEAGVWIASYWKPDVVEDS